MLALAGSQPGLTSVLEARRGASVWKIFKRIRTDEKLELLRLLTVASKFSKHCPKALLGSLLDEAPEQTVPLLDTTRSVQLKSQVCHAQTTTL